jgi:cobalt/nickel transport system permease protein
LAAAPEELNMHLGNGALTPECVIVTACAGGAGLALAALGGRREIASRDKLLLAAGLGALVFAAQAINVPVWAGFSAHLVGGVLLAWVLGPALGAWTMAIVLTLQALALGDGGLTALGANVLNMALLPAGLVALARRRTLPVAALLAGLAVPLAAASIVVETALFRPWAELANWGSFAAWMLGAHLWVGVLEAGLTAGLIAALAWAAAPQAATQPRRLVRAAACCLVASALLAAAWPMSSQRPDGYEAAARASGQGRLLAE